MENPEFVDLPNEYWFSVALNLPDEKLSKFCSNNSKFANICSDPIFWKEKLRRKFPEVNIKNLSRDKFLAKYQLEQAKLLDKERKMLKQERTSELKDYEQKKLELDEELSEPYKNRSEPENSKKVKEITDKYREISQKHWQSYDYLTKEIDKLKDRADQLFSLAEKVIKVPFNAEYIRLKIPDHYQNRNAFIKEVNNLFGGNSGGIDAEKLLDWFKKNGWKLPNDFELADGLLLGLYYPSSTQVPFLLIHIYYSRGFLLASKSEVLLSNFEAADIALLPISLTNLSIKGIQNIYHLPFRIFDPDEERIDEAPEEESESEEENEEVEWVEEREESDEDEEED